jgi:hypothetical protein
LTYTIRPYARSNEGWSIALETEEPLSENAVPVQDSMMMITATSIHNQVFRHLGLIPLIYVFIDNLYEFHLRGWWSLHILQLCHRNAPNQWFNSKKSKFLRFSLFLSIFFSKLSKK